MAQALLSRRHEAYGVCTFEFEESDAEDMLRKEKTKLLEQVGLLCARRTPSEFLRSRASAGVLSSVALVVRRSKA